MMRVTIQLQYAAGRRWSCEHLWKWALFCCFKSVPRISEENICSGAGLSPQLSSDISARCCWYLPVFCLTCSASSFSEPGRSLKLSTRASTSLRHFFLFGECKLTTSTELMALFFFGSSNSICRILQGVIFSNRIKRPQRERERERESWHSSCAVLQRDGACAFRGLQLAFYRGEIKIPRGRVGNSFHQFLPTCWVDSRPGFAQTTVPSWWARSCSWIVSLKNVRFAVVPSTFWSLYIVVLWC